MTTMTTHVRWCTIVLGAILLAGCSSMHEQVLRNRVLRIGVCADYPPIVYKDSGTVCGVEADLAAYVAAQLPAKVQFVEMPFNDLVPSLAKGEIDVVMSGMSDADARRTEVRFIHPYMSVGQMAMVQASDKTRLSTEAVLYGSALRVGCLSGTTGEQFAKMHMPKASLVTFDDPAKAVAALADKKVDVVIDDAPFILYAAKEKPQLAAIPWLLTDEHLAWAVPKDKAYDFLYEELTRIVLRGKQRGDIRRILNRYFEIQVRVK